MKVPANKTDGLLLLHKNPGLTSFESLGFIKKNLSTGKAGHTGTLDKFASGLLIVLVGEAAKLASLFSGCRKIYEGQIHFGIETDTLDPEGNIIARAEVPARAAVETILDGFRGNILQAPPAFSAVHIDGVRAHKLSRQGRPPEMKKRPVTIHELELISWDPPFAGIRVNCSAGTYIRSLARDIALAAGSRGYLSGLVRTHIGKFRLADAFNPQDLNQDTDIKTALPEAIHPITPAVFELLDMPSGAANPDQLRSILHGQSLEGKIFESLLHDLPDAPAAGIFDEETSRLIAVLEQNNGKWQYGRVFHL